jgi:hypothetical protein
LSPSGEGLELFQVVNGAGDDAVFGQGFGVGQIEEHHRHFDVDEVGGNLRAHHACAEDGDFFSR